MKRTLALAVLAAASISAYAGNPQPSFNDNAPVQSQPASTETAVARADLPQPSFNDAMAVSTQVVVTPSSNPAATIAPAPSFAG